MFQIPLVEILLLPILAFCVGVAAAMLGIGGGVFVVPALQLLPLSVEFSPALAAGTSLTMIVFKALSSASGYARQKRIDYRVGLLIASVTVPGAFLGAYLTDVFAERWLRLAFALFLLYVASRMILPYNLKSFKLFKEGKAGLKRRLTDSDGEVFEYVVNVKLGLLLGFVAGVSSGLLGIGGGSLMVPTLHFALSFPIHLAVAASVFIMIFTSTSGVLSHLYFESVGGVGHIRFDYALLLIVGVVLGAQIGAYAAKRVSTKNLRRLFGFLLVIVSFGMILKFLG